MSAKKGTSIGRVLGRLGTLDRATLENLAARLARERDFFESVFGMLREGVLVTDGSGVVGYANEAAARLVGCAGGELEGAPLWRHIPALRGVFGEERDAGGGELWTREIDVDYPEARTLRAQAVASGEGAERRIALTLSDVTRERMSTEQRIERERSASVLLLAASVAHELGNPLNSLGIHLQLLARKLGAAKLGARERAPLAEAVEVCRAEVGRLDGIVRDFLGAVRPAPVALAATDLTEALGEVLGFQELELSARGISLDVELPGKLPPVAGDKNQLKQVIFNVTKNAMEAMRGGGTLRVRAKADDDFVRLLIGDSGAGIRREDFARLFSPFYTTKKGGSGLGLLIAQRIMRAHGGQVGIESKEGVGTVVTLQFPRKDRRVRMLK
ncbi:MAG: PAS domain-containing protein [Opitutaceae bacterium]|jgi:signal transduction histidine kinase|nr:PAS domain-containing protein [Opitutaceae bacterium]